MRYTLIFLVLPMGLGAAELRVDHATVCGQDVKRMQAALTAVGIPSEYGGPHNNHATEMALTSFPDGSYLEQIAIQPKGDAKAIDAHEWSKQMKGNGGSLRLCGSSRGHGSGGDTAPGAHSGDQARNVPGRNRPDGTRLDWETSQVGAMAQRDFLSVSDSRFYSAGGSGFSFRKADDDGIFGRRQSCDWGSRL